MTTSSPIFCSVKAFLAVDYIAEEPLDVLASPDDETSMDSAGDTLDNVSRDATGLKVDIRVAIAFFTSAATSYLT